VDFQNTMLIEFARCRPESSGSRCLAGRGWGRPAGQGTVAELGFGRGLSTLFA
jgi:hypothetical protein